MAHHASYTQHLSEKFLQGAVKFLESRHATENFPVVADEVAEHLEEEGFMEADDAAQDDWSSNEFPEGCSGGVLFEYAE